MPRGRSRAAKLYPKKRCERGGPAAPRRSDAARKDQFSYFHRHGMSDLEPAAVAPVMLGPDGLPRGIQIIAASFEDRTAIACAAMFEALGGGFRAPPMVSP